MENAVVGASMRSTMFSEALTTAWLPPTRWFSGAPTGPSTSSRSRTSPAVLCAAVRRRSRPGS